MDPLDYYGLLKLVDAPGLIAGNGPSCQYVQTPLTAVANNSAVWTCPAGSFCLSPKHSAKCPPGFYCPPNTAQPMYCCEGYYCSADTTTLTLCPQNSYCPTGSVDKGVSCLWLASCPAGSTSASKFGLVAFVIVFLISINVAFWIHKRVEQHRSNQLEKRLKWIHNHNQDIDRFHETDDEESDDKGNGDHQDTSGNNTEDESNSTPPYSHRQNAASQKSFISSRTTSDQVEIMMNEDGNDDTTPSLTVSTAENESHNNNNHNNNTVTLSTTTKAQHAKANRPKRPPMIRKKSIATKVAHTFDIEFEHLGLTLPNGTSILQNVSGSLRSGRTCAIMGPSGSGKTTLITMLTSKIARDEGKIRVNGVEEDLNHYRKLIGFVPQEDIMIRELTVRDVLMHSALMRLPSSMKTAEMTERVLEMIDFLGLNKVMDSSIGDAEHRGISGGQRKRVNIGMELVADPSILLLDEPTSGLDSSTSGDVCRLLKSVARKKALTVAAVIHSPSPVAFDQFDDLLLLGLGGRVVFHGPRTEAPAYFAAIGFPLPANRSPSDYYMDVISNHVKSRLTTKFKPFYLARYWDSYCKRSQGYYANQSNGVEYAHPTAPTGISTPSTPYMNPRTTTLMPPTAHPRPSTSSNRDKNHHHHHHSIAMTQLHSMSNLALPSTSSSPSTNSPTTTSSSTAASSPSCLSPPSKNSTKHHNHRVSTAPSIFLPTPRTSFSEFGSMYSAPPHPEDLSYWQALKKSLRIWAIETRLWWKGIFSETFQTYEGLLLRQRDPIRNTASTFRMFWLCLVRARLQVYRNKRQFLYDQLLHLGCGFFISIAASRFDYLGKQPDLVCAMAPYSMKYACSTPVDHLTEVGVFVALGVCFAGISVGAMTFGNEKIVYWREKSSGLLTFPYYLAKVIADIPRIVLAGIMFSISLVIFFNQRSNYLYLLLIITVLYAAAFAMGYLLSALIPQQRVALVGTGFTLAWAIVFSGDAPDLADVMAANSSYSSTKWLWVISAPRYAIEAIYLREVQARPWAEIQDQPLSHTYKLDDFWMCFKAMAYITLGWHVLAFFSFKLKDRNKQK